MSALFLWNKKIQKSKLKLKCRLLQLWLVRKGLMSYVGLVIIIDTGSGFPCTFSKDQKY